MHPDQQIEATFDAIFVGTSSTAAQTVKSATSGKNICILDVSISTDTAQSVKLVEAGGGSIVATKYLPANGTWSKQFRAPKIVPEGSALLVVCGGSSGNVSVEVGGYLR